MNTKRKLYIDKIVGIPILFVFYFVTILFKNKRKHIENVTTIAICKLKGMGSIIQSTPLITKIKQRYPNVKIVYITTLQNKQLMQCISIIDEVIYIDDSSILKLLFSTLNAIVKTKNKDINLYFDLEIYAYYSTVLTAFSMAKIKKGFHRSNNNIRNSIYDDVVYYNTKAPVAMAYSTLLLLDTIDNNATSLYNFKNSLNDKITIKENLKKKNLLIEKSYIVINPNASDLRIERRWGTTNYAQLINKLADKLPNYTFVLIGSKNEVEYVQTLIDTITIEAQQMVINTAGLLTINELITIINHTDLFITNDTGPMHIGLALNVKMVALFGPVNPNQCMPNSTTKIIYKNNYCSPCVHHFIQSPCKGNNICMQLISVEEVNSAAISQLNNIAIINTEEAINYTPYNGYNPGKVLVG